MTCATTTTQNYYDITETDYYSTTTVLYDLKKTYTYSGTTNSYVPEKSYIISQYTGTTRTNVDGYFSLPPQYTWTEDTWTAGASTDGYLKYYFPRDKKSQIRNKIKGNLIIQVKSRAQELRGIPENEQVAIESLREIISESEFRKYLKYGFVLVQGKSGQTYQVFRNRAHTRVWQGGKLVEEICVRIASTVPATDNVIAFKTMIEASEEEFRKAGNVYKMAKAA